MSPRTLVALAWTLLIVVLCWLPKGWTPEEDPARSKHRIPHVDKAIHAALFAGFGLLWSRARPAPRRRWPILLAGVALAVVTELGQGLPAISRDPDVFDALADLVGLIAGVAVGLRTCPQMTQINTDNTN